MSRIPWLALLAAMPLRAQTFDFETDDPGVTPAGWSTMMTHAGASPRWVIVEDTSAPSGARAFAQLSDDPTVSRFPLAVLENLAMTDGVIRVSFKPLAGDIDRAAGLVWRLQDENNYYVVRANALENNVVTYKVEDGHRTSLEPWGRSGSYGVKHTVASDRWATLSVDVHGSAFVVSLDDQTLYEVRDSTFQRPGRVGIWTKADSVTYFDDFEVVTK